MNMTLNQLAALVRHSMQVNTGPLSRAALAAATGQGNTKQDTAWQDFGWPDELDFLNLHKLYTRNALAKAVVTKPVEFCWSQPPQVIEGRDIDAAKDRAPTAFENAFNDLADRLSLYKKMRQADIKGRVGFYSALLIRVAAASEQDRQWDRPLGRVSAEQVIQLVPVYSQQLKVSEFDTNPESIRYGQPVMYSYNGAAGVEDSQQTKIQTQLTVHYSRVIVFTETPDSEAIEGIPALAPVYNYLLMDDLIVGAGGQGFWKNSGNKLAISAKGENAPPPSKEETEAMNSHLAEFDEGLFKQLVLGGFDVNQLQTSLNDPGPFEKMNLARVSAGTGIPQNILNGTQTGVLAGDKDMMSFLQTMNSRCANWCAQMIEQFVDWCQDHGALPRTRYLVQFPDLTSANEETKLTLAGKMTAANQQHLQAQAAAGIVDRTPLFTTDEIRAVAGFEPLEIEPIEVDDIVDDPEMDDEA